MTTLTDTCSRCGDTPVRISVDGELLCNQHRAEWLEQEAREAKERRVQRVMGFPDLLVYRGWHE